MKSAKESIVLIGGGGHCSSVIDVIELQGIYRIAGIVDIKNKPGLFNLGYKVIAYDEDLPELVHEYKYFIITLGQIRTAQRRKELFNLLLQFKANIPIIISPLAYISKHATVGVGTVIMHMAQVNASASIGRNCIINSKALIEHDASIGDHCHISTNATVNGGTKVGESCFIGSGAVCRDNIEIEADSFIKANSLVK